MRLQSDVAAGISRHTYVSPYGGTDVIPGNETHKDPVSVTSQHHFWTIYQGVLSAVPPNARRVLYPYLELGADTSFPFFSDH